MIMEKIVLRYWESIRRMDMKRMAKQSEPEGIEVISDIPYVENAKAPNLLDVYYPKGTKEPLPVIIDVHGGGWLYGNKELNKIYAMDLAKRGFGVVNINYHLVQEQRFPQQIKDIYAVFNWLYENGNEYYLDIDNVFITGDSAGAHLSSISAALLYNDELRGQLGVDTKLKLRAGGMICGAYDLDLIGGIMGFGARGYQRLILGGRAKKFPYIKHMSLIKAMGNKMIPLYLMTSRQDFIKTQTFKLVEHLKKNGMVYKLRYWEENKSKKLTHVFNVLHPIREESIITNDEMCEFFRSYIK